MPGAAHRLARDLKSGDRILVNVNKYVPVIGEVISVEPAVRIVKRRMVLVTIRTPDGQEIQRRYGEHFTIPLAEGGT
jgi:hypothetical protein